MFFRVMVRQYFPTNSLLLIQIIHIYSYSFFLFVYNFKLQQVLLYTNINQFHNLIMRHLSLAFLLDYLILHVSKSS